MSRKHFKKMAAMVKDATDGGRSIGVEKLANELAKICKEDNPNFKESVFFEACGLTADGRLA